MPALTNPKRFYVYELIDPRSGAVFYVGKGCGRRAWQHAKAERGSRERNALKAEVLGQIRRAGLAVTVRMVAEGLTEEAALRMERGMIVRDHARLTNIALGARTAIERIRAEARNDLAQLKPLCQLLREGCDRDRLRVWARVVGGLSRIAVAV